MNFAQVILKPVLTEKSVHASTDGKYTFVVHQKANKVQVKKALKALYGADVAKVNMLRGLPKYRMGRTRSLIQKRAATKRAVVTLKKGTQLDLTKLKTKNS